MGFTRWQRLSALHWLGNLIHAVGEEIPRESRGDYAAHWFRTGQLQTAEDGDSAADYPTFQYYIGKGLTISRLIVQCWF